MIHTMEAGKLLGFATGKQSLSMIHTLEAGNYTELSHRQTKPQYDPYIGSRITILGLATGKYSLSKIHKFQEGVFILGDWNDLQCVLRFLST